MTIAVCLAIGFVAGWFGRGLYRDRIRRGRLLEFTERQITDIRARQARRSP